MNFILSLNLPLLIILTILFEWITLTIFSELYRYLFKQALYIVCIIPLICIIVCYALSVIVNIYWTVMKIDSLSPISKTFSIIWLILCIFFFRPDIKGVIAHYS